MTSRWERRKGKRRQKEREGVSIKDLLRSMRLRPIAAKRKEKEKESCRRKKERREWLTPDLFSHPLLLEGEKKKSSKKKKKRVGARTAGLAS